MANKRISELTSASTLTSDDLIVLVNELQTRKTTLSALLAFFAEQDLFALLDDTGTIPENQFPDSLIGVMRYAGSWNPDANTPAIEPASAANKGLYYVASTDGTHTVDGISEWKAGDWIVSNGGMWQKIDNSVVLEHVLTGLSVQTGAITAADDILTAFGKTQGQLNSKEDTANKGAASGYASLDSTTKLPIDQLPVLSSPFTTATTAIAVGDTIQVALGKAQGQINTKAASTLTSPFNISTTGIAVGDTIQVALGKAQGQINTKAASILTSPFNTSTLAIAATDSIHVALGKAQGQINLKENSAKKGVANGYASLDAATRIPIVQLPFISSPFTLTTAAIVPGDTFQTGLEKVQGQVNLKENSANKGAASGYASLDANTKLPKAQLTKGTGTFKLDFNTYSANIISYALWGYFVPAGALASGDQLNLDVWLKTVGGPNMIEVYFSNSFTAGVAPTGTLVATYANSSTNYSDKFKREFSFTSNTAVKSGIAPATSSNDGTGASTADAPTTIPSVSAGFWVVIAGVRSPGGSNGLAIERVALTGLFQ